MRHKYPKIKYRNKRFLTNTELEVMTYKINQNYVNCFEIHSSTVFTIIGRFMGVSHLTYLNRKPEDIERCNFRICDLSYRELIEIIY